MYFNFWVDLHFMNISNNNMVIVLIIIVIVVKNQTLEVLLNGVHLLIV